MKHRNEYSKTGRVLLLSVIPLLGSFLLISCNARSGIEPAHAVPTVMSTSPRNDSADVPLQTNISITFSEVMDPTTITTASFTLMQGTAFVSGTVSYSGNTATFTPASNLAPGTTYTATFNAGGQNLAGESLANNFVWNFTTISALGLDSLIITSSDPLSGGIDVPMNQKISTTFSMMMDATTITSSTFTLTQDDTPVPGFVSYSRLTAIFSPSSDMLPNTPYKITMTTGARSLAGNTLPQDLSWSFTTGPTSVITRPMVNSSDPADGGVGVPLNQKIAVTFTKTMDASTITAATFTLKKNGIAVPGFVLCVGPTALFMPSSILEPNAVYTATMTTGAKDLAGNSLAKNISWNFTTGMSTVTPHPLVNSIDPTNLATEIFLNQKIAATFSKTMDASTITAATFTLKQGNTAIPGFVSYVDKTALFAPLARLASNTSYTATITTGIKDLAGNALADRYAWTFTTGAATVITPPTVSLTNPTSLSENIPLSQKIAVTFSKTMDASTITAATFTVKQGSSPVAGFVSCLGTTAVFSPSNTLASNTTYTVTIHTGAKDLAGNALASNYVWVFTTGDAVAVVPPTVGSTEPTNHATGVALNQKIAVTFSKAMDASTMTAANFTLKQGSIAVPGFVSYSGTTALFAPTANLAPNTIYTVTMGTSVKDLAGAALASDYVWSFTTAAALVITLPTVSSSDPDNLATNVPVSQKIAVTFSKAMDVSTITTGTFTLKQGATPVAGFISYASGTATFSPLANLAPSSVYTATVSTGAKDLTGTALASDHVWSFTTAAAPVITLPTVISTAPTNGEIGVAPDQNIAAVFSEAMDASTITTATVTVKQGSTPVPGFVAYDGTTATFIPSAELTPNTVYTATVRTGVKNLAGNTLATDYGWTFTTGLASVAKVLKSASSYAGFGGSAGLTNQGISTEITGDLGTTGACSIVTGFHDMVGNVFTETVLNVGPVSGDVNCAPPAPGTAAKFAAAQLALDDATAAYVHYAGLLGGPDPGAGELGGQVLVAGTYTAVAGTFGITVGNLTLDAENNPNARWVFQMSSALNVGQAGQPYSVVLINGAQAKNVVWVVGSAATINSSGGGTMEGTILANSGITFSTAGNTTVTTLNGRAISLSASVTMVNTVINVQ